jgi:hypothetical protein
MFESYRRAAFCVPLRRHVSTYAIPTEDSLLFTRWPVLKQLAFSMLQMAYGEYCC